MICVLGCCAATSWNLSSLAYSKNFLYNKKINCNNFMLGSRLSRVLLLEHKSPPPPYFLIFRFFTLILNFQSFIFFLSCYILSIFFLLHFLIKCPLVYPLYINFYPSSFLSLFIFIPQPFLYRPAKRH